MDSANNKICEEFEPGLWLFLDGSMEEQLLHQWNTHISECSGCSSVLKEACYTIESYNNLRLDDIKNISFNRMIRKAVAADRNLTKNVFPSIQKNRSLGEIFGFYKLAFGGTLLAAALIFIFITFFNNPKIPDINNRFSNEMLGWNTPDINERLINIGNQIISLKTNDWDIYIVRKNKKEEWNSALRTIQKQIRKMQKEVVSTAM